jgi:hypothetical protein
MALAWGGHGGAWHALAPGRRWAGKAPSTDSRFARFVPKSVMVADEGARGGARRIFLDNRGFIGTKERQNGPSGVAERFIIGGFIGARVRETRQIGCQTNLTLIVRPGMRRALGRSPWQGGFPAPPHPDARRRAGRVALWRRQILTNHDAPEVHPPSVNTQGPRYFRLTNPPPRRHHFN